MSFQENVVTFAAETTAVNGMKTNEVFHINGNGKEKDFETGYHYYGARYYDSEKMNWLSVDPLSDKYPSMSPYAYCANNPVILVDPDGRDIWIIGNDGTKTKYNPGEKYEGSDEFTRETFNALNRNCKYNDASRALKHLANGQRYQIEIHFSENTQIDEDAGLYDATYKAKISFNPYLGLRSKKTGKCITPATGLNHEFGHFLNMVEDIKKTKERLLTEVPLWGNKEEELTIKKYEHPMAEYFGEYLRESHDIKEVDIYTTKSSISTEKVERK